ncbi:MAG: pyridoxamine 5'-phosphate oxidase family protein, partial [Terriglobia bacterium]
MPVALTGEQVWKEIESGMFAVLGYVNPQGEARTSGIVYHVRDRRLYIGVYRDSWKARHIASNPRVSLTVALPRRIPFFPWVKIPPATITFQGEAEVRDFDGVAPAIGRALVSGLELEADPAAALAVIQVKPRGEFLTYGIGVPLRTMTKPGQAAGRAP